MSKLHYRRSGIGNLSLVAGQKQTLQVLEGRTNFSPKIRFRLLFMMLLKLGNLWNSWYSQFIMKPKMRHAVHLWHKTISH